MTDPRGEKVTDSLGPLVDVGHLRSVTLALNLSACDTDDVDPLVRHIRSSLLSLDMKGVLKVEPVNDHKLNGYNHPQPEATGRW